MNKSFKKDEALPIERQDFATPEAENNQKASSHGEQGNQKGSDFTELEETRMDHPPQHREDNGSDAADVPSKEEDKQSDGVK